MRQPSITMRSKMARRIVQTVSISRHYSTHDQLQRRVYRWSQNVITMRGRERGISRRQCKLRGMVSLSHCANNTINQGQLAKRSRRQQRQRSIRRSVGRSNSEGYQRGVIGVMRMRRATRTKEILILMRKGQLQRQLWLSLIRRLIRHLRTAQFTTKANPKTSITWSRWRHFSYVGNRG